MYLALKVTQFKFQQDLWHQKARVPRLSFGILSIVLLCVAILRELQLVADRQTDSHTAITYTALA